jgi:hypothetical protein
MAILTKWGAEERAGVEASCSADRQLVDEACGVLKYQLREVVSTGLSFEVLELRAHFPSCCKSSVQERHTRYVIHHQTKPHLDLNYS